MPPRRAATGAARGDLRRWTLADGCWAWAKLAASNWGASYWTALPLGKPSRWMTPVLDQSKKALGRGVYVIGRIVGIAKALYQTASGGAR